MPSIYRLSKSEQDFVFSFTGTARAKEAGVSMAIATVLVNNLCFLSNTAKEQYFTGNHKDMLLGKLSMVNEMLRIDADRIMELAQKLYAFRYSMIGKLETPNPVYSAETALADFFGLSRFFSKEDLCLVCEQGVKISNDALKFQQLFNGLGFFSE